MVRPSDDTGNQQVRVSFQVPRWLYKSIKNLSSETDQSIKDIMSQVLCDAVIDGVNNGRLKGFPDTIDKIDLFFKKNKYKSKAGA